MQFESHFPMSSQYFSLFITISHGYCKENVCSSVENFSVDYPCDNFEKIYCNLVAARYSRIMNAGKRSFPYPNSGAGTWHCFSRIIDRAFLLDDAAKDFLLQTLRAYEDLLGVEMLTFCLMGNHFHLLLRVPHRPDGFDLPLEVVVARMERAVGAYAMKLVRRDLAFWETTGNVEAIEQWRRRQVERMFSLSEFMGCVKQRFTRWHNARTGRRGTIWEERFGSVVVEEEERALRTMAAYIDLNPVRAGIVGDPADYRWSGYAEAMAGKTRARRGLVRIIGQIAWSRETVVGAKPWGDDVFPKAVETRALVFYRAILGGQGAARKREDGTVVRRGLPEKVRERLTTVNERRLAAEVLTRRVQHFTKGMILGSRAFVDGWFERNREICQGRSRTERQRGSRSLGKPALRGLYALRDPQI
jgi:REP element-mobilizing transposase RayT